MYNLGMRNGGMGEDSAGGSTSVPRLILYRDSNSNQRTVQ